MKSLHVIPIYCSDDQLRSFQTLGGGERYPFELTRFLALTNKNDSVEIMLFGNTDQTITMNHVKMHMVKGIRPFKKMNKNFSPIPVSKKFLEHIDKADIVHGYHIKSDTTTLTSLAARMKKKPMVLTDFGGGGPANISKVISNFAKVEKLGDATMCISNYDSTFWDVKNKTIIYGGVDLHKYTYHKEKKNYVLYAGRILPHKGLDTLIKAIPENMPLIIAGRAFNKNYLDHLKEIAKDKQITFIENPADEKLVSLYKEASCFILPSTHTDYTGKKYKKTELFGLVVVEAMASGTPVIVSSAACLPELVENGINGFVFKDGDANDLREKVETIVHNKKLIETMGVAGRKIAEEKYNWEVIATQVRETYNKLIKQYFLNSITSIYAKETI